MKILIVNNHTRHLSDLQKSLIGHDLEVQLYQPGIEFHDADKDLIILSGGGGEGLEIDDKIERDKLWYEDEMNFVLRNEKPMIGICMGFEVISRAYGSDIPKMNTLLERQTELKATAKGASTFGTTKLSQFEAHQWHVVKAPVGFEVLADSDYGIEIIRKGNILATQFHPEKGGTLNLPQLLTI
ncbi:gamma-glutamyl-gamma-aminobutyrate hydrolase family protein [Candidatus Saccharibacteria bacterium]|nr:gamma-glutamyl-gamma-aminobutyrate hydrolase family protein [Candidatus Saccharibacteria bacterium]